MDKEKNNNIKVVIVVIILLAVFSLFVLLIIKVTSKGNSDNKEQTTHLKESYEYKDITNDTLSDIEDESLLFYGQNVVNTFLGYTDPEIGVQLLSDNYINNYNINKDNYLKMVLGNHSNLSFKVQSGKMIVGKNYNVYYALKGYLIDNDYGDIELIDKNYVISLLVDYSTEAFAIYPDSDDVKEVLNGEKVVNVKRNNYNQTITSKYYDKYDICSAYYNDFIFKVYYDTDLAYSYLNDDTKRSLDKKELKEHFSRYSSIDSCEESGTGEYIVYNTDDQTVNISVNSIMDYNVSFE